MGETDRNDDAEFVQRLLNGLSPVAVPAALERRILDDFDRLATRTPLLERIAALLWPGVPAWAPASALAVSLIVGLAAGAAIPSSSLSRSSTDTVIAAMDLPSNTDDLDTGSLK